VTPPGSASRVGRKQPPRHDPGREDGTERRNPSVARIMRAILTGADPVTDG